MTLQWMRLVTLVNQTVRVDIKTYIKGKILRNKLFFVYQFLE